MTRAMRERQRGPAPAAPVYALIKVRLPEGLALQVRRLKGPRAWGAAGVIHFRLQRNAVGTSYSRCGRRHPHPLILTSPPAVLSCTNGSSCAVPRRGVPRGAGGGPLCLGL